MTKKNYDELIFKRARINKDGSIVLNGYVYPLGNTKYTKNRLNTMVNAAYDPEDHRVIYLWLGEAAHKIEFKQL